MEGSIPFAKQTSQSRRDGAGLKLSPWGNTHLQPATCHIKCEHADATQNISLGTAHSKHYMAITLLTQENCTASACNLDFLTLAIKPQQKTDQVQLAIDSV